MNFMSGRSGICKEITASTGIISMSSSSSPSSSSSSLQPYIHRYNNRRHHQHREEAKVAGGLDRDDHVLANSSTARPMVLVMEREHMFDKVVTPSDVGKLNRLVIPKHHAEKYFPLGPTANEKGLLLNFEDRNGKPWRFRYSYWNSSQSYVMTKGWSRFVKEKKLDAGDIVSFQRGLGDLGKDRLFIDWRRRPDAPLDHHLPPTIIPSNINIPYYNFSNYNYPMSSIHPWNPTFSLQPSVQSSNVFSHIFLSHHHPQGSTVYLNSGLQGAAGRSGGGGGLIPQHLGMVEEQRRGGVVFESVPVVQGKAAAKRLRLFGVNMDCPISESDHENDLMLNTTNSSSSTQPQCYSRRPLHLMPLPPPFDSSSSNSFPSLQLESNYNSHADHDKGKGSTSLDLDI